jgi:zinc protease
MPRHRLAALSLLAAVLVSSLPAQTVEGPRSGRWAHENSSLQPDPAVVWGRLDNGVRYALLPHKGVPGRLALRYVVLAGAVDERPEEAGIAHFTEHLAFRGTPNFKAEEMVSLFQRLGVEYGSDVNAVTTHDYTSYMLDYREHSPDLIREGLRFFRGIADGPVFEPQAIVWESRVILAEMRSRDSLAARNLMNAFPVVFRGAGFARHAPIGTEQSIRSFRREHFLEFHRRNYRPDLTVIVAAGDFDPAAMAAHIRDGFGDLPARTDPPPVRDEGRFNERGLRAGIFRISGVGSAETLVASVQATGYRPDSKEAVVERQQRAFVMELFNETLGTRVQGLGGAQASYQSIMGFEAAIASAQVPGKEWAHGVLSLDQIVRNTHRNGFDRGELDRLRTPSLRLARYLAEQVATLDPLVLCEALAESIVNHTVFVGPAQEQRWQAEWLERFDASQALETFRRMWNPDNLAVHIGGDVDPELETAEVLRKVQQYRRAGLTYLQPPPVRDKPPVLRPVGSPSPVLERREVPELGAVLIKFGNNVRLNFVSSRQRPGFVSAAVRVGSGLIDMPGRQPALKEFGLNTVLASGTGRFTSDQISRLLEEEMIDFGFDLGDYDAFTFRGRMSTANTDTFLGVVADFLRAPRFARFAHDSVRQSAAMSRTAGSIGLQEGMRELTNHLFQDDARFAWGNQIDYISLSVVDVRRWMEPALTRGYVELTLVGDLSEQEAVDLVGNTLGALDPRAPEKRIGTIAPARVRAPAGHRRIEFLGEHNLGLAVGNWPVEGTLTVRDKAALNILTKVLELRIREEVRENLGLAYAPAASFQSYNGFEMLAMIQATADCAPTEADRVARIMSDVAHRIATEGVQEGEFIGSRGILTSQLRRAFLESGFVQSMLIRAQEKPSTLDDALALRDGLIATITLDEVNAWAKKILPNRNSRSAAIVPKTFIGIFETK